MYCIKNNKGFCGIDGNSQYYLGSNEWSNDNTNPDKVLLFDTEKDAETLITEKGWQNCVVSEFKFVICCRENHIKPTKSTNIT